MRRRYVKPDQLQKEKNVEIFGFLNKFLWVTCSSFTCLLRYGLILQETVNICLQTLLT